MERLTFERKENTQATYLPQNGKSTIAFVTDDGDSKDIAVLNDTDEWRSFVLTSSGQNLSPTFSPNGAMILYVTEQDGERRLATISSNGTIAAMLNNQSQLVVTVGRWLGHPDTRLGVQFEKRFHAYEPGSLQSMMSSSRPTRAKASIQRSSCSGLCAADIWVRIRAAPLGTTGKEKPIT